MTDGTIIIAGVTGVPHYLVHRSCEDFLEAFRRAPAADKCVGGSCWTVISCLRSRTSSLFQSGDVTWEGTRHIQDCHQTQPASHQSTSGFVRCQSARDVLHAL